MIADADGHLKERSAARRTSLTGSKNLSIDPFRAMIRVDDATWYSGKASCILVGNVGKLFGGIEVFADARADDGQLELGVVTADGLVSGRARSRARRPARQQVPVRPDDQGTVREDQAESEGPVRARRRRTHEDESLRIEVSPGCVDVCVPTIAA